MLSKARKSAPKRIVAAGCLAFILATGSGVAYAQKAPPPSLEEMWRIIQAQAQQLEAQAREIAELKRARGALETAQSQTQNEVAETRERVAETEERVVATAEAIEQTQTAAVGTQSGWWDRTSIGGYGELHYEGGDKDEVDFHRFVLFFGHEFNDRIRFFSEVELEHALAKDTADGSGPGEVELEQAYIQMDLNQNHRLNAGVQLLPVGLVSVTHEPPTFFGVERNRVESDIIPATWWEAGIGLEGNFGKSGLSYNAMLHSGLDVPLSGGSAFKIRSGRKKVAKAPAKDPAITGTLKYTGITGVELAASAQYQVDITQGDGDPITGEAVSAFLFSTHMDARYEGFGLRALYASWWLDGETPDLLGRDRQYGFYLEPSYRFAVPIAFLGDNSELGFFYRFSKWNNEAGENVLLAGVERHTFGANFWPHPNVVFKIDWFREKKDSGDRESRINLGAGYQF